jgi:serine/threonine protein kinase
MSNPSSSELAPVREGDLLDGKYRVDRVLGVGGMGIVVAATHVALNQRVALKFLLPAALANQSVIERFAREARAAVQIQSEHIARVTDVGTLPTGSPYMVMEYLEGNDLADVLEKGGPMKVQQAVGYVLEACEAIAEAHALGIVHRDLKPANLFLARRMGRNPIVKVLDFGISKTKEGGPAGGLTQTSAVMGSPYYMAPEQIMSAKDVDARTDLWALGIILYELLSGAPPFVADSMPEIVYMVTQRDPPLLREKRPDVPQGLADAIATCLSRDPARRFEDTAKLAVALAPFGPPRSEISLERIARVLGASVPPSREAAVSPSAQRATGSTWARSQAGARVPSGARIALVVVAVVLLAAGIGWRAMRASDSAASPQGASATFAPVVVAPSALAAAPPPVAVVLAPPAETTAPLSPASASNLPATPATSASTTVRPQPARPHPASAQQAQSAPSPPAPAAPPSAPTSHGMNMGLKE